MLLTPDRITSGLSSLQKQPDRLITPGLINQVSNPEAIKAVSFKATIHRLEYDYTYPLAVAITETGRFSQPTAAQEDDTKFWGVKMNYHREIAIKQGLMSEYDGILLSLIASSPHPQGVFIDIFILAQHIHGKKIVREFMSNFHDILAEMGYSSISGIRVKPHRNIPKQFRLNLHD